MKTDHSTPILDKKTLAKGDIITLLTPYAPAGFPIYQEIKIFFLALGISAIYSLGFLIRYLDARADLFETTWSGQKVIIAGARMPEMTSLLHNAFLGFLLMGLLALAGIFYHYLFHSQGSKSIYLMKRLPNPMELHKRCITLPLIGILISLITALLLFLIYYGIYFIFTPKVCLPTASLTILRSVIL